VKVRPDCRLCLSTSLTKVLHLEPTPPANEFCKTAEEAKALDTFPLYLVRCENCGHVQLPVVVDPERLFRNYVYVSGTSPSFVEHFKEYAESVVVGLPDDALVVDIGSNDGTLLRQLKAARPDLHVLGVDPAEEIAKKASNDGIMTVIGFFNRDVAAGIRAMAGNADLITANNVFAHADNLEEIARGALDLLTEDGRFVFEVQYLNEMVHRTLFDMVYHEHLSYHSVRPLVKFFASIGASLVDVERVATHGGSIRCTVRRGEHSMTARGDAFVKAEADILTFQWQELEHRIAQAGEALRAALSDAASKGVIVAGFGAPAKMTTLTHRFGIDARDVAYVIDDSPWKQGLYAPGTGIPVVGIEALHERPPGMIVIFAWNFAHSIAAKLRAGGFTGRIVTPLPILKEFA
jgi:SAM-dependent methyltransferase